MTFLNVEFWAFVGVLAGIYTIFALGLQIQFGFTGLLNFGQAAFMAIGAYTMAILVVQSGLSLWLASLLALVASAGAAVIVGLTALRLRAEYFAITTLAFAEIVRYVAMNEEGLTGGTHGTIALLGPGQAAFYNAEWITFQSQVANWLEFIVGETPSRDVTMLVIVWSVAIVLISFSQFAVRSPWGRVLRSIREDEDAAAALGKNVLSYKIQALVAGAVLGAIAGLFHAYHHSFFSPVDFDPLTTFFGWVIVLLGGTARTWAVPVGAVVFGVIFAGARFFGFWPFVYLGSAERAYVRFMVIGAILIGLMLFRPHGILGRRQEMTVD